MKINQINEYENYIKRKIQQWKNGNTTKHMETGRISVTLEDVIEEINNKNNILFVIEVKANPIGYLGLYNINWIDRKAELRILIGNSNNMNQGYGTEAITELLIYAFDTLNLNRVWLGVNENNKMALKCYEKCGFIQEGCLEEDIYLNDKYFNIIRMRILKKEWKNKISGAC